VTFSKIFQYFPPMSPISYIPDPCRYFSRDEIYNIASTISSVGRLVGRKGYREGGEPHTYSKIGAKKRNFGIGKPKKVRP
jgi:hypothetical protein